MVPNPLLQPDCTGQRYVKPDLSFTPLQLPLPPSEAHHPEPLIPTHPGDRTELFTDFPTVGRFSAALTLRYADAYQAEAEAMEAVGGLTYNLINRRKTQWDTLAPGRDWLFRLLGVMMHAVLPARKNDRKYARPHRVEPNVWVPSRAALAAGNGGWRFAKKIRVYKKIGQIHYELPARHQTPRMKTDDRGRQQPVPTRLWLLQAALDQKEEGERRWPIPAPLMAMVNRELHSLFVQATIDKEAEDWLDWGFEFPVYSEQLVTVNANGGYVPHGLPAAAAAAAGVDVQMQGMVAQVVGQRWPPPVTRGREPWSKNHFTVSEVGERVSDQPGGTNWALAPDDQGGYDVWDISCEFFPGASESWPTGTVLTMTCHARQISPAPTPIWCWKTCWRKHRWVGRLSPRSCWKFSEPTAAGRWGSS